MATLRRDDDRGSRATDAVLPVLTLETTSKLLYFSRMLNLVRDVAGDVVECGVGWGHSLLALALLVRLEERGRRVWGFDSFEGFPEPSPEDQSPRNVQQGEWKTDMLSVLKMIRSSGLDLEFVNGRVLLVKGFFADSLARWDGDAIALLHVDADLYQSTRDVLDALYPKLAPGGVMMFDEYGSSLDAIKWPGARKAIADFVREHKQTVLRDAGSGKCYAVKRVQ